MPVIARVQIDGTINLIKEEIRKCGCISADTLAIQARKPVNELKDVLRVLAGSGEVSCNSDYSICCADKARLEEFSEKLKRLRGRG